MFRYLDHLQLDSLGVKHAANWWDGLGCNRLDREADDALNFTVQI
jgi:hypothetical protein